MSLRREILLTKVEFEMTQNHSVTHYTEGPKLLSGLFQMKKKGNHLQ